MDPKIYRLSRRTFLADLGKGVLGVALLGTAACGRSEDPVVGPTGQSPGGATGDPGDEGITIRRVDLGFVSAYVLVRGSEAAVVDTGEEGSAPEIGNALDAAGLGWEDVRHLILTHAHPDHIGSVEAVLGSAGGATPYAGAPDIPEIPAPREVTALSDGDDVFGMQVIATPGHTPGHISIFDPQGSVLVAGDALFNQEGLARPPERFNADQAQTDESIRKLAQIDMDRIVFGHGDPIEEGASAALDRLVSSLQ